MIMQIIFIIIAIGYFAAAMQQLSIDAYGATGWRYAVEVSKAMLGWLIIVVIMAWLLL